MASFEIRGNSIRAIVRFPGGKKKTATFDTRAEAEAWAAAQERSKSLGTARAGSNPTVGELFEAYLPVAEKHDAGRWNNYRLMRWLDDPLASKRLHDVLTHDINEWITRRSKDINEQTGKPITGATVNRELNLMSGAFTYAIKDRRWIDVNPCHGARRPGRGRPRKRPLLTSDEIKAICIATGYDADPQLSTLTARVGASFLLALETGMRSGEILRIRPADYLRSKRTIHVSATERGGRKSAKSGRSTTDPSRDVPLTARAKELLDQLLETMPEKQEPKDGFSEPPYIVGVDDRQRDALWRKARDRSGVENLTYHDTKHEAATRLSRFLDVLALSHAIGTKDVRLLRDTYYNDDAQRSAALLPDSLSGHR